MNAVNDIKISVIIPLYYAEDYVDDLLGQLLKQPFQDIEIICVIDGSPDETLGKVQAYAQKDSRIRWVSQENAGAGAARNAGLELARGEYLAFLDADDLYDSRLLGKMYETAKQHDADLVMCQFTRVDLRAGREYPGAGFRLDRVRSNTVLAPSDLDNPFADISVVPYNKLFRKAVVDRESLRFSPTRVSNDIFFALAMVAASERIVAIPDTLVAHCVFANPQSITSNRVQHLEDVYEAFHDLRAWLAQRGLLERYRDPYIAAWTNAVHYNATFGRNERFLELAAQTLACDEPWCSMSDKELRQAVCLDTSVIALKKLVFSRERDKNVRALGLQRLRNEEDALREIAHRLNTGYGKHISERRNALRAIAAHLRAKGIRQSAGKLAGRLLSRRA